MKLINNMKLIIENWRKLTKEATEASPGPAMEKALGFSGMQRDMWKKQDPEAYKELMEKDLEDTYLQFSKLYDKDNPGKFVPLRSFLDNLGYVKTKYPEAFSDTQQATPTRTPSTRVEKMYNALRSMSEDEQLTDPNIRVKYENALAAVNELMRVL